MTLYVLNAIVYGSLHFIIAVGLVLLFGLRQVVNFSHGALFMMGAYIGYAAALALGFWWAILVSTLIMAVVGALIDRFIFKPLQKEDPIVTVLVTFGILLVLEDVVQFFWGPAILQMRPPAMLEGSLSFLGTQFPTYRIAIIAISLMVVAALVIWVKFTKIGLYIRASSTDPITAGMQGVNPDKLSMIVVAVGVGIAGLAGVIAAPYMSLTPSMGATVLIDSFIIIATGGLASFTGAFIAAMVIGLVRTFGIVYIPELASMIPFLVMVAVLIWRPEGLMKVK